ncbi:MAG: hypothetical protein Q4C22_01160 [Bacillota bacterium]|nr:hypothetical protein [Bacillota bacterium]
MQEKQIVKWGNVFKFAGAFIAFLIGSGFATGQEILQYFTSYGYQGLLTILVMFILFIYVSRDFIVTGYREQFSKGSEIFQYYCGKYIGAFYDFFTIAFVFMSYVVMIGGAGATLNQHYGLPTYVGGILIVVLAGSTVICGLGRIVDIIGRIGPIIVLIAVGIGLYAVLSNFSGIAEGARLIEEGRVEVMQAGSNWFISASSYVGFCMLWLAAFLAAMGKSANSEREATLGSLLGTLGFSFGCLVLMLGFLAYVADVAGTQVPSLVIAVMIHPGFATIFSVIIIAGIYTTAVPLLWQASSRFTVEKSKSFVIVTIILAIAGGFIGLALPFNRLVNIIYVINGYVGILLIVFMIWKGICRVRERRKQQA